MVDNFRPDHLQRIVGVGWAAGTVAILDAIEPDNGIPDDGTDYIQDQVPQVKLLKPFEHTDFVGTLGVPETNVFDSDPHPTGSPEYVDGGLSERTTLPTVEQFATGYIFYKKARLTRTLRNGAYYASWIINLGKLRTDLKTSLPNQPFTIDLLIQREYFGAFPPWDARPFKTALWTFRIYKLNIDKFAVDPTTGQINPIDPVLPTSLAALVVPLAQEGEPGFPAHTNVVMKIPEHALYDGTTASFAAP